VFFQICCGKRNSRVQRLIFSINQYLVDQMAARTFGIDINDTDGGDPVKIGGQDEFNKELSNRMEQIEKMLAQVLASKDNTSVDTELFHDSLLSRA
jgi:hypothetical protein